MPPKVLGRAKRAELERDSLGGNNETNRTMKQKLLFIFVLLCAVAQGVQASTIDLATLTTSDIPTGVVAQNGDVLTGTLSLRIKVSIAAGASVDA